MHQPVCYTNLFLFSHFEYKPKPPKRKDKDYPKKKETKKLSVTFMAHGLVSEKQTVLWATRAEMKLDSLEFCVPALLGNALTPVLLHSLYLYLFCFLVQDAGCNMVRLEPSRTCSLHSQDSSVGCTRLVIRAFKSQWPNSPWKWKQQQHQHKWTEFP